MIKTGTTISSVLLYSLWISSVPLLVSADDCGDNALALRDDDDDNDNGDHCTSSTSHRSHTSSTATASAHTGSATIDPLNGSNSKHHGGLSKGGIAGVVLAILFGLLLLLLLLLCLRRRSRQRRVRLEDGGAATFMSAQHERKEGGPVNPAGVNSTPRAYANIPASANSLPTQDMSTVPLVGAAAATVGTANRHWRTDSGPPLNRSASTSSLPNPHEADTVPSPHDIRNRDLPPTPNPLDLHELGVHRASTAFSATTSSHPPSSFFDPIAELTRGSTSRTTTSMSSTLHSEMASYQKQLEAHHEKEMQARDDVGGSSLPIEPPPEYRERLLSGSTSDLGEVSHGTEPH